MNILKDYVMLKKYPETERNLNGEIVYFTYNKKTQKINIPYNFNLETYKNTENPIRFIDFNLNYSLNTIQKLGFRV